VIKPPIPHRIFSASLRAAFSRRLAVLGAMGVAACISDAPTDELGKRTELRDAEAPAVDDQTCEPSIDGGVCEMGVDAAYTHPLSGVEPVDGEIPFLDRHLSCPLISQRIPYASLNTA
jgi:hypothetical protein